MDVIFLYGPPASGKYTIGKMLAEETGYALFHNHLIVDAVGAVFPFGTPRFVRLREKFWLETLSEACSENRSIIFTFQPEASVSPEFPEKVAQLARAHSGRTIFVYLMLSQAEQEARVGNLDRAKFGKLRDPAVLRAHREEFAACEAAMPRPDLVIDSGSVAPADAVRRITAII